MAEPLYTLITAPGVRRDGTVLDSPFYSDGTWVRWQRGKPRKMGGYRASSMGANGPVRAVVVDARNGAINAHYFSQWGIQRQQLGPGGAGAALEDRTPSGFVVDPTLTWSHAFMYSGTGSPYTALIAASSPDLNDITNDAVGNVYYGNALTSDLMVPVADGNGPIQVSGGICVLQPFLFAFGSNGLIRNSNINDFSVSTGWTLGGGNRANIANVAGTKVVCGAPTRGGTTSPSGLFWALDSLIRVSFVGGTTLWNYDTLSAPTTLLSKRAIVEHDGKFFWPGVDRFLMYAGVVQELPNDMNQNWFFDNLNFSARNKVWGTKIQRFGEIWWFYPRGTATECTDAVIFNYRENTWYDAVLTRSAGDKAQGFRFPVWVGSEDGQMTTKLSTATVAALSAQTLAGMATPTVNSLTTSGSGGTLAPSTLFYYKVSALNAAGETLGSIEQSITTASGILTPTPGVPSLTSGGTGLTAGTQYFYKLTALNGSGETQGSAEVNVTLATTVPTPTFSSAVNNQLSGQLGASTTYYYKISALNASGETLASSELSATTAAGLGAPTSPSATASTTGGTFSTATYYYKITALNANGETSPSSEVSVATTGGVATPVATTLVYTINGYNGNFNANTTYYYKVVGYNGAGTTVGSNELSSTTPALINGPTASSATDVPGSGTLSPSTTYYYVLTSRSSASAAAAESTKGNEVSVTTSAAANHSVTVAWAAVSGAVGGYVLYRGTTSGTYTQQRVIAAGSTSASDDGSGFSAGSPPTTNTTAQGEFQVSWNAASGATGYRVYRGTSAAGENGYYDVGNVVTYDEQGYAFNFVAGSVPGSNTTGGSASVALSWTAVAGATGYRVYRGTSAGAEDHWQSAAGATFTDTGSTGTAASPPSSDTTALNQIALSWVASAGATSYRIYRGTAAGAENVYYNPGNVTGYTDGNSVTFTSGSPAGSNTTANTQAVALSWGAVTGATSYRVYRGTSTGGESVFYAPGNVTSYTDTGAASSAGSPPTTNTTATATCSNALGWGAVSGATGYRVYRGTTPGGENVYYAPGNVTSYTDTNAASTGGTPAAHNTTSNVLTFAAVPAGVANGNGVTGDPGIPAGTTVASHTGTTVTLSDAVTSSVPSGTIISFTAGNSSFPLGSMITGVTSAATGTAVRVTGKDLNVANVTGTFLNGEVIGNGTVSVTISAAPVQQQLDVVYQHEFGFDKVVGQQENALPASFTTHNFGFAVGSPMQDVPQTKDMQTLVTRIEPDWNQVGDITITINGRAYAQSQMKALQSYVVTSSTTKQDVRGAQARILSFTVASNALGGFFEQGQVLIGLEPGDERTDAT